MTQEKRFHFVGIGGAGMSGIAEVLVQEGHSVSGSDAFSSETTKHLRSVGVTIFIGHDASYVEDADVVVKSTAISLDNPEIKAAQEANTPILRRADMLAEIMRSRKGIAISGTHGKTTATSLMASVFVEAGLDPTYIIGGRLNSIGSHAALGAGEACIVEADESDASFLTLSPTIAVVTNIDEDHLETYQGDFVRLQQTFVDFLHRLPAGGLAVLCFDDPVLKNVIPAIERPVVTYGFSSEADFQIQTLKTRGICQHMTVFSKKDQVSFPVRINMPGQHNALNALAAIVVAYLSGVSLPVIEMALEKFQGVDRRFSVFDVTDKKLTIVDDYGHHPRELAASFKTAKDTWPDRRLIWVFQPHRYTRTRDLFQEFCDVLTDVDHLILCDVYPAGEVFIEGADGHALYLAVKEKSVTPLYFAKTVHDAGQFLKGLVQENDVILLQGAGDVTDLTEYIIKF